MSFKPLDLPDPQIPTHAGLILTCPDFTSGIGICSYRKSFCPWNRTAFILPFAISSAPVKLRTHNRYPKQFKHDKNRMRLFYLHHPGAPPHLNHHHSRHPAPTHHITTSRPSAPLRFAPSAVEVACPTPPSHSHRGIPVVVTLAPITPHSRTARGASRGVLHRGAAAGGVSGGLSWVVPR